MKSRRALTGIFLLTVIAGLFLFFRSSPLDQPLKTEFLAATSTASIGEDRIEKNQILPFGHTLGPWPGTFRGEPIVTRLTYRKGPPDKFLDQMTQIWRPVDVELTLFGPTTVSPNTPLERWKSCFTRRLSCKEEKNRFWSRVFPEKKSLEKHLSGIAWFESPVSTGAQGVRMTLLMPTHRIDRYAVITPKGAVQVFSLKTVLNPVGLEGRELFLQTLADLRVSDDLSAGRKQIEDQLRGFNLEAAKKIASPKARFESLIRAQTLICSHLSVDPTSIDSFFHLAGVTHRLAIDLLRSKERIFESQDSWILNFEPVLSALIRYARDFPNAEKPARNMEALLQDVLLLQGRPGL